MQNQTHGEKFIISVGTVAALMLVIAVISPFYNPSKVLSQSRAESVKSSLKSVSNDSSMNIEMLCPIFQKAKNQNTSIIIMGDSRTAVGWGPGSNFVAALNYYFYQYYGKLGMTPIAPGTDPLPNGNQDGALGISSYHGYPWGDQNSNTTMYPPPIDASPYHWNSIGPAAQGPYIFTDGNATTLNPNFQIATDQTYFKLGNKVTAEYFLRKGAEFSDKVQTKVDVTTQEYWDAVTETEFSVHDLPADHNIGEGFFSYKQDITEHASQSANNLINVGLRIKPDNNASSTNRIEVLGGRFISSVESGGVAVTAFSMGGWTTTLHLSRKSQSLAYAAMNPDLLMVFLDVNDIGTGVTPEQYKANMLEIISRYREAMKNMKAPVLLVSGYPAPEPEYYTVDFPNKLKEIAAADPNVAWISGYKIYSDRPQIDPGHATDVHLTDGIDAKTFAQRIVNTLLLPIQSGQKKCAISTPTFSPRQ